MTFKNKIQIIVVATILLGVVFYGGYQFGTSSNNATNLSPNSSLGPENQSEQSELQNLTLFWDVVDLIKEKYYKIGDIDDQQLLYGAVEGVVRSLDDPYSTFFVPEDAQKFEEDISGSFGGIGAEIGIRQGQLVVVAPLKGNPADEVGLKSGDKILKVDDTFTNDITLEEAVKIIRGEVDSEVALLILRDSWGSPQEFKITRRVIQIPTLDSQMLDSEVGKKDIAYIQLYSFNANAPRAFYEASFDALLGGSRGIILDLRNNSGGFLDVSINIAGWFLDRGDLVVTERFRSGEDREFRANGSSAWGNVPVAVLVNEGSASASEILAGALRDHLGATLVGNTTFGKGTVQEVETLSDGSKVKISVAEWVLPSGGVIEGTGLAPDFEVDLTDEDIENELDPQLEKALEIIREKSQDVKVIKTIIL